MKRTNNPYTLETNNSYLKDILTDILEILEMLNVYDLTIQSKIFQIYDKIEALEVN